MNVEKNRYFAENQGKNALGAAEHFTQFAAERQKAHLDQYSGRAHNAFGRMSTQATLHFAETGAGYARQQKGLWEDSVLKGAFAQHDQIVAENYTNGDYINAQTESLKERIAAMRPGLDNSAVYAQIDRTTVGNRIGAFLAGNNVGAAKALFAQQGSLLGGQADEYMARIRRAEDRNIARANVARREKMLDIQDALPDAEYYARQTGDPSQLYALAADMNKLGNARGAEKVTRNADIYKENADALRESAALPLPDAIQRVNALDAQLTEEKDPHTYRALASKRDVLVKSLENRAQRLNNDPALAVDTGVEYENRELQATDRLSAQAQNGLPIAARRVLTKAESAGLKEAWQSGNSQQRLAVIDQLGAYGQYAGKSGAEIGLSPSETALLNQVKSDPYALSRLSTVILASSAKSEDLPRAEQASALAKDAYGESHYIKAYTAAGRAMPGNASMQRALADSQRTLGNLARIQGDGATAAKTMDGPMLSIVDANFSLVYDSARLKEADVENVLRYGLLDNFKDFTANMPFASDIAKRDWLYHMRRRGVFVNAPDNNGFILIDPVSQAPVMNSQGRTFRITEEQVLAGAKIVRDEKISFGEENYQGP